MVGTTVSKFTYVYGRLACEGISEKETSFELFPARCHLRLIGNQFRLKHLNPDYELDQGDARTQGDNRSSCEGGWIVLGNQEIDYAIDLSTATQVVKLVIFNSSENAFGRKDRGESKMEGRATWFCMTWFRSGEREKITPKVLPVCLFFGKSRATGNTE